MLNGRVRKEEEEANKSLDYDDLVMSIIVYRHIVSYSMETYVLVISLSK